MPSAVRGDVRYYDFGAAVGDELSSCRPALIISDADFNKGLSLAIAVPTSTSTPPAQYERNHVRIESTGSWASARQIKSVKQKELGAKLGEATPEELEEVLKVIASRLWRTSANPGVIQTQSGYEYVERGSIFNEAFYDEYDIVQRVPMLVLDFNKGNNMAVVVEVEYSQNPQSAVRIPIKMIGSSQPMSALVHHVDSIDFGKRDVSKVGTAEEASTENVISALRSAIVSSAP